MFRCVLALLLVMIFVALGDVSSVHGQTNNGNPRWSSGFSGSQLVGSSRLLDQLNCLGLPIADYTETYLWDGFSRSKIDAMGRLHVKAKGTFSWAIYPYAENIPPDSTDHQPLYSGSIEVDLNRFVDNYVPGSVWEYTLPSLSVSGSNGSITLFPYDVSGSSILGLRFSDESVPTPTGTGATGGQPVCSAGN